MGPTAVLLFGGFLCATLCGWVTLYINVEHFYIILVWISEGLTISLGDEAQIQPGLHVLHPLEDAAPEFSFSGSKAISQDCVGMVDHVLTDISIQMLHFCFNLLFFFGFITEIHITYCMAEIHP